MDEEFTGEFRATVHLGNDAMSTSTELYHEV